MVDTKKQGQEEKKLFDPNDHLIQLKSKNGLQDYLPVQFRLVWFRQDCPNGKITTQEMEIDLDREVSVEASTWNNETRRSEKSTKVGKGYARFRATVEDGKGGYAEGTGSECAADFGDFVEKAETKAVGRALAMLGYGTQFAPEFDEGDRIVDAPVNPSSSPTDPATVSTVAKTQMATDLQLASIHKLLQELGKPGVVIEPTMTYLDAKTTINALSAEYKVQQEARKATPTSIKPEEPTKVTLDIAGILERFKRDVPDYSEQVRVLAWMNIPLRPEELADKYEWKIGMTTFRTLLDKWVTPHAERLKWQAAYPTLAMTDEQKKFILGSTFGFAKKVGSARIQEIMSWDAGMHGQKISEFTALLADRLIHYYHKGVLVDVGNFLFDQEDIPVEFRYQEPKKKIA